MTIPRGTDIFVTLGGGFNSKSARPGDRFFATVAVPVIVDDQIVIPQGSKLLGRVSEIRQGAGKKEEGWIGLAVDSVVLPSGASRKMEAVLTSVEGKAPEEGEKEEIDISRAVTSAITLGMGKVLELFGRKPDELPRGASITIQTQHDLRLVPVAQSSN
ncbi:MAG: hypothetical protein V3T83_18825 [Acidobacteriota bacterium]